MQKLATAAMHSNCRALSSCPGHVVDLMRAQASGLLVFRRRCLARERKDPERFHVVAVLCGVFQGMTPVRFLQESRTIQWDSLQVKGCSAVTKKLEMREQLSFSDVDVQRHIDFDSANCKKYARNRGAK